LIAIQLNRELLLSPEVGLAPFRLEGVSEREVGFIRPELVVVVEVNDEDCFAAWLVAVTSLVLPLLLLCPVCVGLWESVLEESAVIELPSRLFT
jgi:hypothetical protein